MSPVCSAVPSNFAHFALDCSAKPRMQMLPKVSKRTTDFLITLIAFLLLPLMFPGIVSGALSTYVLC